LYFRDDGKFTFRKLNIEDTFLVEKRGDDIIKGWKHFFKLQFPFAGLGGKLAEFKKGIGADMVTLGFDRDIIFDPFNQVPVTNNPNSGKPAKTDTAVKQWTAQVAESQRYKVMNKPGTSLLLDKVTLWLGIGLILLILILGMSKA